MRAFRLSDVALTALAAGRPSRDTIAELRRAQISRHLLLLREIVRHPVGKPPLWYADPATRHDLADPMAALHTAATLTALRTGTPPPPDRFPATRFLTAAHDGLTLRVRLEDTDPLRAALGLTPTAPLAEPEAAAWQDILADAWSLLVTRHRPAAEILAQVLTVLIPIEPDPGAGGLSATSAHAFGAVALSAPADALSLAVALIHETQHSLLNATRTLFDLVRPGAATLYSPWRDDPRPAFGLLHGAYAYLAVTRFWQAEAGRLAEFEFVRWRAAVAETADALLVGGSLTGVGRRFVRAMRDEVGGWLGEAVDPTVARLAEGANAEHRARWRLRNLVVGPETAAEPELRPAGGRALGQSERLRLVHRVLREGDQSLRPGGGVRPGDLAYLGGEAGTALNAYLMDLEGLTPTDPPGPNELEVWSGIAVVAGHERAELLRAVYLATGHVDLPERRLNSPAP